MDRLKKYIIALVGLVMLIVLTACGQAGENTTKLTLSSTVAEPPATSDSVYEYVVRCTSITSEPQALTILATKSKSEKISHLIFFNLPDEAVPPETITVAVVPLNGLETDYTMSQAKYYSINYASAQEIVNKYSIMYSIWQSGAGSGAEKFDCCE